jgi:hypothetical protein
MSSPSATPKRTVIVDGPNATEVLNVLRKDLGKDGTEAAIKKASKIIELSVDPLVSCPNGSCDKSWRVGGEGALCVASDAG